MRESSPGLSASSTTNTTASSSSSSQSQPRNINAHRPSTQSVIEGFNSFKKSQAPARFLYLENNNNNNNNNAWVDFPCPVFDELSSGFLAGKPVLELSVDGRPHLFDFLRMVRIDLSTKVETPIAWIDVDGQRFFPNRPRTESLDRGDKFYKIVERLFVSGMKRANANANVNVKAVRKCLYPGDSERLRLRGFQMMVGMTKAVRGGDANVRFGWYGAPAEGVEGVVRHGFGRTNDGVLGGGEAHGVGVHLSPPHFPYKSSLLSEPDESGEKHIVLCRVIMGNSETVEAGSSQYHPSTDEFDSGVDHPTNPKWYVVWSTHMNTHILPEYVVTFKSSSASPNTTRRPLAAAGLSFQKLLSELGKCMPCSKMQALEMLYNKHKMGKMSKDAFIRYLRTMAGDKLLASTIRRI